MEPWAQDKETLLRNLSTSEEIGLSQKEARKRLKQYGQNQLEEKKEPSFLHKFLRQFQDFMIIALLAAAAVSFGIAIYEHSHNYTEPVIILGIVIINALIGTCQEARAQKAVAALKRITTPYALVLRDGALTKIPAAELVPGDILQLSTGEIIPADVRFLHTFSLYCEEAALTGESVPSGKNEASLPASTPLADRKNMGYSGTIVSSGHGTAIVTATGMDTEIGKIADILHGDEAPLTPLQKNLSKTGKILGTIALFICILMFFIGILQKQAVLPMFMTSISLAVAAIPEGLPAIVTLLLSLGVLRLAKKNTIIRHLPAVETLGSATVICSDKTGTLTMNKMTVKEHFLPARNLSPENEKKQLNFLSQCCLLCTNSVFEAAKGEIIGEPTENALFQYGLNQLKNKTEFLENCRKIGELPFNSTTKQMSTLHPWKDKFLLITKGAPEKILDLCDTYFDGNETKPLTPAIRRQIKEKNLHMAKQAYRTIAFSSKILNSPPDHMEGEIHHMTYTGLLGMIDPPRPEAKDAIAMCKQANIKTIMITGDQKATAVAIASQLGITNDNEAICTGKELDEMSDEKLEKEIDHLCVFARVEPKHKVRIVKVLQRKKHVVAMTGDGVNDAPALKVADIGCAMGKSGTDAAKSVADLLLLDDNFATIVAAVKEGRGIFLNIRRTIHFLLSCNIGEIITIFLAVLMTAKSPLLPIHLLWVNLITDSLPAFALGMEPTQKNIMSRPLTQKQKELLGKEDLFHIITEGAIIGALALLAYSLGLHGCFGLRSEAATTMCFCVLCFSQLVHAINLRSEQSVFKLSPFSNLYLLEASICCFLLQCLVILLPLLAHYFQTTPLQINEWLLVGILSLMPLLVMEIQKASLHSSQK